MAVVTKNKSKNTQKKHIGASLVDKIVNHLPFEMHIGNLFIFCIKMNINIKQVHTRFNRQKVSILRTWHSFTRTFK